MGKARFTYSSLQKIPQQIMAMFRQDGFGMELYAFDVAGLVSYAHDFVDVAVFVLCPGGYFQAFRQAGLFDDQGMVAGGGERVA